jgi:hypothetical protein
VAEQLAAYAKDVNLSDQAQQLRDHVLPPKKRTRKTLGLVKSI